MRNILTTAQILVVCAAPLTAFAQRDGRNFEKGVVTVVNNKNANPDEVEQSLKKNAPVSPKDNGLPRFAIVGSDKMFYMGIGAQFLGEAMYDWGDKMNVTKDMFIPSSIVPSTPGNRSDLGFAWSTSSIYVNIVAMPGSGNQIGFFFKGNFLGGYNFSCNHIYARYRGLTAGYTTSLFTDLAAEPLTIDFQGPNGFPFIKMFTAYWEQPFSRHFSGAIGIEAPTTSMTDGDHAVKVNQRVPSIPLYLQYAWGGGESHLRLSGLVRPMQYRDEVVGRNHTLTGLGVQLSGIARITPDFAVNCSAVYGRGIASYLHDNDGLGLDAMASVTEPGRMAMVKSMGLTGGLSYRFSSRVSSNVVYSHVTNWLTDAMSPADNQYRYGDYVAANVIYHINKFVSTGIEYDYGHRKSCSGEGLHTNRVQLQFAVTF